MIFRFFRYTPTLMVISKYPNESMHIYTIKNAICIVILYCLVNLNNFFWRISAKRTNLCNDALQILI